MSRRAAAVVLLVLLVAAACGGPDREDIRTVRGALARTDRLPTRFVYTEETDDVSYRVEGEVEDDFRYRARLIVDGRPAYEEIVSDDAIYARILSDAGRKLYLEPDAADADTVAALESRRWVRDPVGAPSLVGVALSAREVGQDPVFDAVTYLRHIDEIVLAENSFAVKFDRFDYDYRPQEDPFPTPEDGSDVERYDIRPIPLPKAADRTATGNQAVPAARNFRKLGVYVRNGRVVQVLEDIDVASRLDDIRRNYDIELSGSERQQVALSVQAINAVRRGQGDDPIRVRRSSLELIDLGRPVTIDLPTEHVVDGDLSILRFRGRGEGGATADGDV